MDFRAVDPSTTTWSTWTRGQPGARARDGSKVVVQTPTCPCRVSLARPGMYRVDLKLHPAVPVHAQFAEWVGALEESASEAAELAEWRGKRRRSACVYNDGVRLMAFSDTLAFDEEGKLSADLMDAAACAALVELQGLWSTDTSWGLRWRVTQLKFSKTPLDLPAVVAEPPPPALPGFAFVDE